MHVAVVSFFNRSKTKLESQWIVKLSWLVLLPSETNETNLDASASEKMTT